jgi:hypothetical protein
MLHFRRAKRVRRQPYFFEFPEFPFATIYYYITTSAGPSILFFEFPKKSFLARFLQSFLPNNAVSFGFRREWFLQALLPGIYPGKSSREKACREGKTEVFDTKNRRKDGVSGVRERISRLNRPFSRRNGRNSPPDEPSSLEFPSE